MKIDALVNSNSVDGINAGLETITSGLVGAMRFDVLPNITTNGVDEAFTVLHKLGVKPEGYLFIPEEACIPYWTSEDKRLTDSKQLVLHSDTADVTGVVIVFSRAE